MKEQMSDRGVLTMFAELPAEHVPGPPPLASGVRHDARLLTDRE